MPLTPKPLLSVRAIIQGYIPGQRRIFLLWSTMNATRLTCSSISGSLALTNTSGFFVSRLTYGRGATFLFTATGPGGSTQSVITVSQTDF